MKTNQLSLMLAAVLALMLSAVGCNAPAKETATQTADALAMTPERKQAIEAEISALTKPFFQHVEKLDIEACMTLFENTPDFLAANPDGTAGDYNALKKLNADGFGQMNTIKLTIKKEVIKVLSDSLVLFTFFTKQDITLKTGQKMKYDDVAGTMLFTKINGTWKATFYQESAAAPVDVK